MRWRPVPPPAQGNISFHKRAAFVSLKNKQTRSESKTPTQKRCRVSQSALCEKIPMTRGLNSGWDSNPVDECARRIHLLGVSSACGMVLLYSSQTDFCLGRKRVHETPLVFSPNNFHRKRGSVGTPFSMETLGLEFSPAGSVRVGSDNPPDCHSRPTRSSLFKRLEP